MKQRVLAMAVRQIVWAEIALAATLAVPAFAQSQPAAGPAAVADALASGPAIKVAQADTPSSVGAATADAPAGASGAATTAAPAGGNKVQQIKRFEVTGSLIRSSDKVGFNQVQTITPKEITSSGATTVADFLRNTTANSANSWSEGQSSSFAAGAAGIALRGLPEKYTLVLVDGQRVAPFAFFSNADDSFFDLNTLPLNAIERIEIVKTGAVSQYGSDAIGGVVNIITKHDFRGVQLDGSLGSAINSGNGDGTTKFGILAGFGDLNADRFNITAAASYYKSNGFTLADRDSTRNQDFTGFPGGLSVLAPSYWNLPGGNAQALAGCPGGSTVRPAGTNSLAATNGLGGTVCGLNTAESMSILPMTERLNAKLHGDFKVDDKTTAFGDFMISSISSTSNQGTHTVGNPQG
ncbi:TonB-dependent receptor plug domain-containing protein, partial [Burkholderia gladioli]|nr:TonB-dependent receptor plug domain-containing protein [Burkholderia gladioli]